MGIWCRTELHHKGSDNSCNRNKRQLGRSCERGLAHWRIACRSGCSGSVACHRVSDGCFSWWRAHNLAINSHRLIVQYCHCPAAFWLDVQRQRRRISTAKPGVNFNSGSIVGVASSNFETSGSERICWIRITVTEAGVGSAWKQKLRSVRTRMPNPIFSKKNVAYLPPATIAIFSVSSSHELMLSCVWECQ
jgi:hypothetical protein